MGPGMGGCRAIGRKSRWIPTYFFFAALAVVSFFSLSATHAVAQQFTFNNVVVDGNARIGESAILNQLGVTPGQSISAGELNSGVQRLQNSGLFETVNVEPQGSTLRVEVVELPTINRISFEGNRRLRDEALSALVQSQERRVFNPAQAERDASVLAEAYANQGRLAARVTPRIIRRSQNRVDLVFEVFEGDVVEVERLSFVGNRAYSDRRLRRVLDTKQAGILRQFIQSDVFIEDRIEFDKQVLRDFYQSRGYVDFRTLSVNAELSEERDGYFLVFNVQEGQQFRFGQVSVTSEISSIDPEEYQDAVKVRPEIVYSPSLVENEIARLETLASRNSVDFLRVEPRITRNDRDLTLDVEFVLQRGPRVFIERIDIEGNTTTLDRVIRQRFRVAEGDPFNPREIREAAERIRALGYFATAEVNAREGSSPDRVVVDVDVEEQSTGSLNFGASFGANDGFGFAVLFSERNFLGRGQVLNLSFSTAEESERYGIRFVEPQFLGRDVQFALDLDYSETDSQFVTYDTERFIFRPSLTFPVSESSRLTLRYTAERSEMVARDPVEHGFVTGSEIDRGNETSSALGYTFRYDSRIRGLDPTQGLVFEFSQDIAGLGGDNEYLRTTASITGERAVFGEDVILRATLEGGALAWNSGTSRGIDRFSLGPRIFRGFEPSGIGPRDLSVSEDDALGGNLYVVARFEAEFPLGLPTELGIRGAVFYDVGNLWDLSNVNTSGGNIVGEGGSFRHVIGFGILWDTVFGPLRFNFTEAIVKEDFDRDQSFDLTISTNF